MIDVNDGIAFIQFTFHVNFLKVEPTAATGMCYIFTPYYCAMTVWIIWVHYVLFQFSIVECVLSALSDEFAHLLKGKLLSGIFRSAIILLTFLLGLPMVTKVNIRKRVVCRT